MKVFAGMFPARIATASITLLIVAFAVFFYRPESSPGEDTKSEGTAIYDSSETDWDDYLWPTDAGTVRTSDFAEFRRTHFHAGLDVSTGGRTGYNVFAMRDGWVHSLNFQPGGYGWILILRHHDGYYTSYAHLRSATDSIMQSYYDKLRLLGKSYGLATWERGEFPVTRGDIIAYTGDTGAGPPHLHFEIRDKDFNPVNPGLSRNLRPVDSLPPEIRQLMLVPLDASSSINESWSNLLLTPVGSGPLYSIGAMPVIRGNVGVMVRAHDRANGATDYPSPYRLRLLVDGREYFTSTMMRFADSLAWHIRIDRDHSLMQAMKGEFRKLYREEGNRLDFYVPRDIGAGVLSAESIGIGRKHLSVIAEDIAGNRASATFTVMLAADVRIQHEVSGNDLRLKLLTPDLCDELRVVQDAKPNVVVTSWNSDQAVQGVSMDMRRYHGSTLRIVTIDTVGNEQIHARFRPGPASRTAGRLYTRREIIFDEIVYDLRMSSPFTEPPVVRISQGGRVARGRVFALDASRYRAVLPTWAGFSGLARIEVEYNIGLKHIQWTDSLHGVHITPHLGGQIVSDDGQFVLSFSPFDVYRPMLCFIETLSSDTEPSYRVTPDDVPLSGRPLAAFRWTESDRRVLIQVDSPMRSYADEGHPLSHAITARVGRFLGRYRLLRDTSGPDIRIELARRSREAIRVAIGDSVSGVESASIVAMIDDMIVPLHYSERRAQWYVPSAILERYDGREFSVHVKDRLGNESSETRKLR